MRRHRQGLATVCIELDEKGNATDYCLAYTESISARRCCAPPRHEVCPAPVKGVAVPSRFNFGYEFTPDFSVP